MDPREAYKYCVRCGNLTSNKDSIRTCPKCEYKQYINPSPTVTALIFSGDKILLTTRGVEPYKGKLDTPGGFVELNETFEEAIQREVKEELGVNIQSLEYFNSTTDRYMFSEVELFVLNVNFIVTLESEDFKVGDDVSAVDFYKTDDIDFDQVSFPSVVRVIKMLRNG